MCIRDSNGGTGANGARILSPRTVDLMRMNQLSEAQMRDFNWIQMAGYGYGLGVRTMVSPAPVSYTHLDVYKRQPSITAASYNSGATPESAAR